MVKKHSSVDFWKIQIKAFCDSESLNLFFMNWKPFVSVEFTAKAKNPKDFLEEKASTGQKQSCPL